MVHRAQGTGHSRTFQIEGRSSGCHPVGVATQLLLAAWLLLAPLLLIGWLLLALLAAQVQCCPNCRCKRLPLPLVLPGLLGPGVVPLSVQHLLLLLLHGIACLLVLAALAAAAEQGGASAATAAAAGGAGGR